MATGQRTDAPADPRWPRASEWLAAGLVTLDAHHDIREGRSNGTPVRCLIEAGVNPERIVQVGISDWANSKSYADEAHARGVHVVPMTVIADGGIQRAMAQALDVAG